MATISTFASFSSRGYGSFTSGRVVPTGGDYIIDNNGTGKRVHVFLSPGTFTIPAGAAVTTKFTDLEVLLVGGGGSAQDDNGGAGGGGGAVVYDSAFRIPKGYSIGVTVGSTGGVSKITGLPSAPGGGQGGANSRYSKGQPGGSGGGGSWHNGGPNGPEYSASNPGATWGTSGSAAPTNVTTAFPTPALGPAYGPGLTISRTWNGGYHNNRGNGQYGCTSNSPDSTKGIAAGGITSPAPGTLYSPKAFRMRGGGGASYVGGTGGQGVLTDFRNTENGTYEWMGAGGHGNLPDNGGRSWDQLKRQSGNYGLRDSGVYNGTHFAVASTYSTAPNETANWETDWDNPVQSSVEHEPAGRGGYGSGGSRDHEQDGTHGIIVLRYPVSAVTTPSSNVYGGNITTSANGQYRYHIWYGDSTNDGSYKGTSANSQTYVPFDNDGDYRARYFNSDSEDAYYFVKGKDGQARGANTTPFYHYQDVPSFTVDYMLIGGGGASGTRGSSVEGWENSFLVGGGGSGSIQAGSFSTNYRAPSSWGMPSLPNSLANSASFADQTSGSFDYRVGYIEVRANSLLNSKLQTNRYVTSLTNDVNANAKQRNGTVRIRGSDNTKARLLQRLRRDTIDGYFNDAGNNDTGKRFLVYGASNPGDPNSDGWGSSIYVDSGYDGYFYDGYTKVRAGRKFHLMSSDDSGPTTDTSIGDPSWNNNIEFTLGTGDTATTFVATPTGVHPQTGENYYNALRINRGLPKYSSGSDDLTSNRYNTFHSKISNFNSTSIGGTGNGTGWNPSASPAMVPGLNNVDLYNERCFTFPIGAGLYGFGRTLYGSYVVQQGDDTNTRQFRHIDGWDDGDHTVCVDAGWKIVNVNSGTVNRMTYTNDPGGDVRTHVEVWRRSLRKIWVRHLFAVDTSIGNGGKGNTQPLARRRSGGTTSLHKQDSDNPLISAGGGGAGGWNSYDNSGESPVDSGGNRVTRPDRSPSPGNSSGAGVGNNTMNWGLLNPAGSGGGAAWWMGYVDTIQNSHNPPGGSGANNGSPSDQLSVGASGGGGGGSFQSRDFTIGGSFLVGGATRGSGFSNGRNSKRNAGYSDTGHGGRGFFGSTSPWAGIVSSENISGTNYYYYVNVNQFPHNAQFAAGGGGGAGGDGGDGSGTSGGQGGGGAAGVSYSLTGYSTVYGHGGGGMGRFVNGSPGSSQPADPSTQTVPAGAPSGPAYLPYGGGGGYSAGKQEGLGAGATGYYPGNAPWPVSYDVPLGTAHMDAMRYWNSGVPGSQRGNYGTAYSGKQGVVIISYDRTPYFS
jgi:hypothetical protein